MSQVEPQPALDSPAAVHQFLGGRLADWTPLATLNEVTLIKGGSTNYTFRLHFSEYFTTEDNEIGDLSRHKSAVLKHFPDNILLTPDISFSCARQGFEAEALSAIRQYAGFLRQDGIRVSVPRLFYSDAIARYIIVEDLCPHCDLDFLNFQSSLDCGRFFKQANDEKYKRQVARDIGEGIGAWLFKLHSLGRRAELDLQTRFDHAESRKIVVKTTFDDFLPCIELCGVQLNPQRRQCVQEILMQEADKLLHIGKSSTLVMGDCWMGNLMIRLHNAFESQPNEQVESDTAQPDKDQGNGGQNESLTKTDTKLPELLVHVIDWEFVTYALPYVDLAHLASEAWLFDFFRRRTKEGGTATRDMASAMFQAYSDAGGDIDARAIVLYIAGHIGCFMHYTDHWTADKSLVMAACMEAVVMIENVIAGKWDDLLTDPFLKAILPRDRPNDSKPDHHCRQLT